MPAGTAGEARASSAGTSGARLYIPSLDGIRCLSFLLVFSSHSVLIRMSPGGFGVTVFFFLSGYLITTLLRMEGERFGAISLQAFYLRRTLRIFPPAYVFLGVAALAAAFGPIAHEGPGGRVDPLGVLAGLAYLTNVFLILGEGQRLLPGSDVLWSLAIEEHFYLVFPLLYITLRRLWPDRRRQTVALLGLCAAILVWRIALVSGLDMSDKLNQFRLTFATDTRIDSILFGCILAVWNNPVLDAPRFSARATAWWGAAGAALTLLMLLDRDVFVPYTFRYTMQGLALLPIFVCAVRFADRWPWTLVNGTAIRRWGVLSYTMYLFHVLTIDHVRVAFRAVGLLGESPSVPHLLAVDLVALLATWGIAEAVNRVIERPIARLRRRLSRVD